LVCWFFGRQRQTGQESKTQEGTWRSGGEMTMAFELRVLNCMVNANRRLALKWFRLCYHGSINLR
jgi:hypothetical protein